MYLGGVGQGSPEEEVPRDPHDHILAREGFGYGLLEVVGIPPSLTRMMIVKLLEIEDEFYGVIDELFQMSLVVALVEELGFYLVPYTEELYCT